MRRGAETRILLTLGDQEGCIRGCVEFDYIGIKVDKDERQKNIKKRINKGNGNAEWCAVEQKNNQKKVILKI